MQIRVSDKAQRQAAIVTLRGSNDPCMDLLAAALPGSNDGFGSSSIKLIDEPTEEQMKMQEEMKQEEMKVDLSRIAPRKFCMRNNLSSVDLSNYGMGKLAKTVARASIPSTTTWLVLSTALMLSAHTT